MAATSTEKGVISETESEEKSNGDRKKKVDHNVDESEVVGDGPKTLMIRKTWSTQPEDLSYKDADD